jgi:hypothetical protein
MSDTNDDGRTPAELADDIPRVLRALRKAARETLLRHKQDGSPVAVWEDGHVVWVQPEDIPGPDDPRWADLGDVEPRFTV